LTHKDNFEQTIKKDIEARVRQGVKAVLEEVLQEEMTEHLKAGYRQLTPTRRGERKRTLPAQLDNLGCQDRAPRGA
jgi:transposase-like protein